MPRKYLSAPLPCPAPLPSPVTDEVLLVEETPVGAEEAVLGQGDPTTDVERLEE